MTRHPRIRWSENPCPALAHPVLAAVVWMPDGPAIATIGHSLSAPGNYILRLDGRPVIVHKSPRACRDVLGTVIKAAFRSSERAHDETQP